MGLRHYMVEAVRQYCVAKGQNDDYNHSIWWKLVKLLENIYLAI